MKVVVALLFLTMMLGQAGSVSLFSGIRIYFHEIGLLLLWFAALHKLVKARAIREPQLVMPMLGFAGVAAFSILVNTGRHTGYETLSSFFYLSRWLLYAGVYIIVLQKLAPVSLWLAGLYGSGVGIALIGLVQYLTYPDLRNLYYLGWDPHYYRLASTFLDPNFAGIFLVLTLFLGLYFLPSAENKLAVFVTQLLVAVALLLTYSRGSFLAFLAGILVLAVLRRHYLLIGLGLFFLVTALILPTRGLDILSFTRWESAQARVDNWRQSWERVKEAPLFGHGFGPVRLIPRESPTQTSTVPSRAGAGIDSSLLFVWATTGTIGLWSYGWLMVSLFKLTGRALAEVKSKLLGQVYLSSLVALGVHSLFINSLFYPWVMLWLWVLTGVMAALTKSRYRGNLSKG